MTSGNQTNPKRVFDKEKEYTFDNPDNPLARWGKPYRIEDNRIWLEYIGWGWEWEIRGEREAS